MNSNLSNNCCIKHSADQASRKEFVRYSHSKISMCDILERNNMFQALKRVMSNKGCPGIDGIATSELPEHLKREWPEIKSKILQGKYNPKPVKVVHIPKPNGDKRMLGIPTVLDRLIQQAVLQKLGPVLEVGFSENSYGFRVGRNAHQAIIKAKSYQEQGYIRVVDIDLKRFFDEVNHDRLMAKLAVKINDKLILKLIRKYLQTGMMLEGAYYTREKGTPQGSPLSPLLSNLVLDELDKELERRGHKFGRYADDCNIYVKSAKAGQRVYDSIKEFIELKMKLKVNENKSTVDFAWKREFLGYSFIGVQKVRIRCANSAIERFKHKIRKLTRGHDRRPIADRVETISTYIRGWFGYFKLAETHAKLKEIDGWIRSRLRMCLLKLWWRPRTRVRKMLSLGMPLEEARGFAQVKRHWHLAHIKSALFTMNKSFWYNLGYRGLEWNLNR